MVEKYSFCIDPVPYHAWSHDRQKVAVTPNTQEIHVYQQDRFKDWSLVENLNKHDLRVTGIDWAPKTNRIVTCSEDRDAYVWTEGADGKWRPTQVLLRINRAATCVRWSPDENKFAAGSGARLISVCYFEKANDWWVSKHIKKPIKSTVTTLDWHPNNVILAVGCADFKVKIFSGFIKEIEEDFPSSAWGGKSPLGTLLMEIANSPNIGGWVHSVAFSSDGSRLCWVAHDSSISVADVSRGSLSVTKFKTDMLPFKSCLWMNMNVIIAAGHGCCPMLYSFDGHQIRLICKLDRSQKKESSGLSAMKKFQSLDRQARIDNDTTLDTIHQNAVTCIRAYSEDGRGNVTKISTSGLDGQLVIWDLSDLENGVRDMRIM